MEYWKIGLAPMAWAAAFQFVEDERGGGVEIDAACEDGIGIRCLDGMRCAEKRLPF